MIEAYPPEHCCLAQPLEPIPRAFPQRSPGDEAALPENSRPLRLFAASQ
jgi:hypothetical protein